MKVEKINIIQIAYSKNPNKVGLDVLPPNYADLHTNSIDYHINNKRSTSNKISVHVFVRVKPKDKAAGFIQYVASYEILVGQIAKEDLENTNKILTWAMSQVWDNIHFDYIKAMNDLKMPISGFPITPLVPNEEKVEEEKENDNTPSK